MSVSSSKRTTSRTKLEIPTGELLPQKGFLQKYYIKEESFLKTGIQWSELELIFKDYLILKQKLDHPANAIVAAFSLKRLKIRVFTLSDIGLRIPTV